MIIDSSFKPLWWLKNNHMQTLFPFMIRKHLKFPLVTKERIELPDGDFLECFWSKQGVSKDRPLITILHGMGGSIHSSYIPILFNAINKMGCRAVLLHFRCSGDEPNRLPRTYHAGETGDLSFFMDYLNDKEPQTPKSVIGISLGGNVLLKWLGEQGRLAKIDKAVAVSVPFDFEILVNRVNQGFSKIYQRHMLQRLKSFYTRKLHLEMPFSFSELQNINTFWDFDEITTAPLHGFPNAKAYYQSSKCVPYLKNIQVPSLIIHSLDDPFMTPECLPQSSDLSSSVVLEVSQKGGHVGFVAQDKHVQPVFWLGQRIPEFFKDI
ncbi:MAG TPA: hydrolase [Legionellales bacterium]|nr:hydrolase [Legionellales bacterium]